MPEVTDEFQENLWTEKKQLPNLTNAEMTALMDNFSTPDSFYSDEFQENLWHDYRIRDNEDMIGQILTVLRKKRLGRYDENYLHALLKEFNDGTLTRLYMHYCV